MTTDTAMTPERLAEIAERADFEKYRTVLADDALDLLAEVERLRAGVEALIPVLEAADLLRERVEVALASPLLNPTEGESCMTGHIDRPLLEDVIPGILASDEWAADPVGTLASLARERDATVAARALRDAANDVFDTDMPAEFAHWLRETADRIEREGGESDA